MGHSLGAGAAALLALMLKSPYPQVRCYAFSPPRGLLRYSFPFTYDKWSNWYFVCNLVTIPHPQEKSVSKHCWLKKDGPAFHGSLDHGYNPLDGTA